MKAIIGTISALVTLAPAIVSQSRTAERVPVDVSLANLSLPLVVPGACIMESGSFQTAEGGCQDQATGLVWSAQSLQFGIQSTWEGAQIYCATLVEGGFGDWFLPSRDQLLEVFANGSATHMNVMNNVSWSTTKKGKFKAWVVNLLSGDASIDLIGSTRNCTCIRDPGGTPPPEPTVLVTSISPNTIDEGMTIAVTITGEGFQSGVDVSFENGTGPFPGPAPTASNVVFVSATTLTADVTAQGGGSTKKRKWDIAVTNPDDSSGVLAGGFTVVSN